MVICPWCGTNYETFQPNCKNCSGPIAFALNQPAPEAPAQAPAPAVEEALTPPPPAPRSISNGYTLKLMQADSASVVGLVFAIIGATLTFVGVLLSLLVVTAIVGIPFAMFGAPFILVGAGMLYWRYQEKQKVTDVLRHGQAIRGQVTGAEENWSVRVNGRHPWNITYQFNAGGQDYTGSVTTFRDPGPQFQPGKAVYVLYQPGAPEQNVIYPHP